MDFSQPFNLSGVSLCTEFRKYPMFLFTFLVLQKHFRFLHLFMISSITMLIQILKESAINPVPRGLRRSPEQEPHHQIQSSVIPITYVWGRFLTLCEGEGQCLLILTDRALEYLKLFN